MMTRIRSWIETFFLFILVIRPSLDVTTGWKMALGPVSLNPAGFLSLAILGLGAIWLGMLEKEERASLLGHPAVLLMATWLFLLLPWAVFPVFIHGTARIAAIREWIRLLSFLPFFTLFLNLRIRGDGNRILVALLLSMIVPALTGFYQIAFHQGMMVQNAHRIQSTFAHPNPFSFYLVLMAGIVYAQFRWSDRRIVWGVLLFLVLGLLGATFSFTGAGMLGVLILLLALGENRKLRIAILVVLVLFTVLFIATPTGQQRIRTITQWDNLDEIERTGKETSSMVWRLLNWRFLYRTWKQSPWVGYGLDSSPVVNPMRENRGTGPGQEPHNDYVRFLIDTGGIGLIVNLGWVLGIGVILLRAYRQTQTPRDRHFIWVAMALYGTWLAGSMNDNLLIATAYQYGLWSAFAIAIGTAYARRS